MTNDVQPEGISRMSATIAMPRRPQSAAIGAGWSALLVQIGVALPPQLLWATGERIARADGSPGVAIAHLPAAVIVMIITGLLIAGTLESRPGCRGCRCWAFCRALACWQASASIPGRPGIWIAIGLMIYFLYGRYRSRLRAR